GGGLGHPRRRGLLPRRQAAGGAHRRRADGPVRRRPRGPVAARPGVVPGDGRGLTVSCAPSAVPAAAVRSRPLTAFAAVTAAMLVVTVLAWPASAGVTTESARSSNRGAIAAPWQVVLDDVAASAQRTPYHAELLVIV